MPCKNTIVSNILDQWGGQVFSVYHTLGFMIDYFVDTVNTENYCFSTTYCFNS